MARDPATAGEVLRRLALDDNFWVRVDAGGNPALPAEVREVLVRAGSRADLTGFGRPDPGLEPERLAELAAGGEWGRRLAARHPATPAAVLAELAEHPSPRVRGDVAGHRATPVEVLGRLLGDGDAEVRQRAAGNPRAPADVVGLLRRAGADLALEGRVVSGGAESSSSFANGGTEDTGVAAPPAVTAAEAEALAAGGPYARRLAAGLAALPAAMVGRLAGDADAEVRRAAAGHPSCPPEVLATLADDPDPRVQVAVARHPRTPPAALERLIEKAPDDVEMHALVAGHPATPPGLLARLAEHGGHWVRMAVARHPAYPEAHRTVLRRAGADADLAGLATPDLTLELSELSRLAAGGVWARRLAARHPAAAAADLARLATDGDLVVRGEVARHPSLPTETMALLRRAGSSPDLDGFAEPPAGAAPLAPEELESLAASGPWGRRLAARHPAAAPALLAALAGDSDPWVRAEVAAHPRAPAAAHEELAGDASDRVRWAVARHPDAPPAALRRLGRDPLAPIRCAVAEHPSAPADLLAALRLDLDEDVRRRARGEGR